MLSDGKGELDIKHSHSCVGTEERPLQTIQELREHRTHRLSRKLWLEDEVLPTNTFSEIKDKKI